MLELIKQPNDIKKIPEGRLYGLSNEIRRFLIRSISKTGGHLASNLGAVELTVALHYVYDLPKDRIIWDVGHQAYTHKILTGRKNEFRHLRQEGGISGFPRRAESDCDSFDTGHSSNSISAGMGYVAARKLTGEDYDVVSVIGDGALTGGMAFEALNNAAGLDTNFVIVLNDNEMSISKSVGGMSDYLSNIRTSVKYNNLKSNVTSALQTVPVVGERMIERIRKTKSSIKQLFIPGMIFENLGITYLGPIDGHNIHQMIRTLREAKRMEGPVIVHVITEKGRGYMPAQMDPSKLHGTSPFEMKTGGALKPSGETWTKVFADTLCSLAAGNPRITAVTAAMKEGTGLKKFAELYPDRFFDVGIAEGHAVTFSAALALGGLVPVTAVYSSFLQRGFDQLMMDVCAQNAHVVFAVDRAGFVGGDGKSHQGCFDLSYLSMMPNMTVMAPKNAAELSDMLEYAVQAEGPVAIRYPRGRAFHGLEEHRAPVVSGKAEMLREGHGVAILAVGAAVEAAVQAAEKLEEQGVCPTVVNARFVKPLDEEMLVRLGKTHSLIMTAEENVRNGGFGQLVFSAAAKHGLKAEIEIAAVEDCFVSHGTVSEQRKRTGLDADSLAERILKRVRQDKT